MGTPITKILDSPAIKPISVNWAEAEDELGCPLPKDYKALVDAFGGGVFDDFLRVYQPSSEPYLDLKTQYAWSRREFDERAEWAEFPYETKALIPWGGTINGDACFWLSDDGNADYWRVIVHDGGAEWWSYEGQMSSFVAGLLTGEVNCPIFPTEEFFAGPPTFSRYSEG